MVGFFKLVFNDDLVFAIRAKDVQFEVANPMLSSNEFELTKAQSLRKGVEIFFLRKPRRKVSRLVFPSLAQRHSFKFAEIVIHTVIRLKMTSKRPRRRFLRIPVAQDFAEDDGVGEVAVLKVYIGQELIVEGGEQPLDVRFVEAGALEDDDRAGDRAIGEVVEVDGRDIIPAALGKKSCGRSRAEGAFPMKFQVFRMQWEL